MDLPRRYSYDPQWRLILFILAANAAMLVLVAIQWVSSRVGIALGGALIVLALLLLVRRLALPRFVELGPNALSLPTGFLQFHTARIPYSEITRAWEIGLPLTVV